MPDPGAPLRSTVLYVEDNPANLTLPTTRHIPVVAVSANAMPLDVERGLEAGFFRYLTKPIRVGEFMDAVNQALEG